MAGQKGRDVLIQIADGVGGFETLAGIRTSEFTLASARVDATSADSPGAWQELLAGAGAKSARVSGAGVFKDAASDARMRTVFLAGEITTWRLVVPGVGTVEGPFQLLTLAWGARHDGEVTLSVTLESAGALTVTP